MSTRAGKRKTAAIEESTEKPTLKIPEKTNVVCVYENQTGRESLGPSMPEIPEWKKVCNKFLADTVLTHVRVDRAGFAKFREQDSARDIVRVKFSFPEGVVCVFSIRSSGDGGWHPTRVLSEFTPTIQSVMEGKVDKRHAGECNGYIKDALYERIEFAVLAAKTRVPPQSVGACEGDSEEEGDDVATLLQRKCAEFFAGMVESEKYHRENPYY